MNEASTPGDGVIRWGLVSLMAFTPLAFGTVEPWSTSLMEWGIVTLGLIFVLGRLWRPGPAESHGPGRTGMELPVALFIAFCFAQAIPLPPAWVSTLSPGSARQYQSVDLRAWTAIEGPAAAGRLEGDPLSRLEPPASRPVSVHPRKTVSRAFLLAAFALLFFLVVGWCDHVSRIMFLLKTLIVVGTLVAALGLVQHLTWNGKIYWVRKVPPASTFGPFVNHNHFAGYIEMVIPLAIALLFFLLESRHRSSSPEDEGRWGKAGLTLFATVILVVALVLSMSRGGILSMIFSGLILFALVWRRIDSRAVKWSIALALPLLAATLLLWIGGEAVTQGLGSYRTLGKEASFRLRLMVWEHMARHLPDFFWVGSGLGTFEESFAPIILPGSAVRWDRAHNDYLQLLWETGVIGAALFLAGTWIFARRYWWRALRSSGHSLDLFRVGAATALLSIALHSVIDFNLQIGANGFLFVLLAALLVCLQRVAVAPKDVRPVLVGPPPRHDAISVAGRGRGSYI